MLIRNFEKPKRIAKAFALASAVTAFNGCGSSASKQPASKLDTVDPLSENAPNIIFILADDLGYGDVSLNNGVNDRKSRIETPNIDSIAARGFHFTNAYVAAPVCIPSRVGFIASRYPSAFGFERNKLSRNFYSLIGQDVLPNMLKRIGYSTSIVGKWHLGGAITGDGIIGSQGVRDPELLPNGKGFDYFYGFPNGANSYYPVGGAGIPADGWHFMNGKAVKGGVLKGGTADNERSIREFGFDGKSYKPGKQYVQRTPKEHLTDVFTAKAVEYIDAHANGKKPFYLYLAYNAPHAPYQAPDEFYQKYAHIQDPMSRIHCAMIDQLDTRIGEVLAKVKQKGIEDNTLIIFTSDNGGVSVRQSGVPGPAYNGGLRGGKFNVFEGGIRIPFALSWPARYPGGQIFTHSVTGRDIMPTLMRAAGYTNDSLKAMQLDGVDFLPWLAGEQSGPVHDYLYWRYIADMPGENDSIKYAVVKGNLKYGFIREPGKEGTEYLFDLESNRAENDSQNLIGNPAYAKEISDIKSALTKWESVMRPLPDGTPERDK